MKPLELPFMIQCISQFRPDQLQLIGSILPRGKYAELIVGVLSLLALASLFAKASYLCVAEERNCGAVGIRLGSRSECAAFACS